jgi:hypothetical protein
MLISSDGITWSVPATVPNVFSSGADVAWNGTRWVVCGYSASSGIAILTSTDGNIWVQASGPTVSKLQGVAWNGSIFVAVGDTIVTSTDGLTWTAPTLPPGAFNLGNTITWSGTQWIAGGEFPAVMMKSSDGTTWTVDATVRYTQKYTSIVSNNVWSGTAPTTVSDAITRLSRTIFTMSGGQFIL